MSFSRDLYNLEPVFRCYYVDNLGNEECSDFQRQRGEILDVLVVQTSWAKLKGDAMFLALKLNRAMLGC